MYPLILDSVLMIIWRRLLRYCNNDSISHDIQWLLILVVNISLELINIVIKYLLSCPRVWNLQTNYVREVLFNTLQVLVIISNHRNADLLWNLFYHSSFPCLKMVNHLFSYVANLVSFCMNSFLFNILTLNITRFFLLKLPKPYSQF
jgi:hypothetical protein